MSGGQPVAVVLVGIGRVGVELMRAAEQILGPLADVLALGFEPAPAPQSVRARIREAVTQADRGGGVLMIADLHGSTVGNVCYELAGESPDYDVLCGANLAMLMKLYSLDRARLSAAALAQALAETGRRSISIHSEQVRPGVKDPDER